MTRRNETILNLLVQAPWWVSVVLSISVYVVLKFIVPAINFQNFVLKSFAGAAPKLAFILAFILIIPAPFSFFNTIRKRKLLDKQKDLDTIKSLSWKEFEELVAEAYRRKGYSVVENYGTGPNGGVDLVLKKDGNIFIVQCKQWRSSKVDVKVVREMYGVMTAEQANGVIIITSGMFTQEAKNFASGKPIDLVEGNQLLDLVRSVQPRQSSFLTKDFEGQKAVNLCPACGGKLVLRVARHGVNAGNKFWGCSNFPKCKYTKTYVA
jgi:restriction system protein